MSVTMYKHVYTNVVFEQVESAALGSHPTSGVPRIRQTSHPSQTHVRSYKYISHSYNHIIYQLLVWSTCVTYLSIFNRKVLLIYVIFLPKYYCSCGQNVWQSSEHITIIYAL